MIEPIQHIHREHTLAEKCVWYLCHQFGALTILACIGTGAVVLIIIIFRRVLKEKIGDLLEMADKYVNGKK